mgnify:CR=1 FL=1
MRFLILFLFILSTSLIQAQEVLLESKIKKSIENVPAQVGVAIIINGKDTITVNNECHYPLMSVMKYPQALAVLHYLHQHNQPLSTKIFIPKEALLDDTYSPLRDKYPEGNIYMPIAQLLDYTIQKSDNNACDMLFKYRIQIPIYVLWGLIIFPYQRQKMTCMRIWQLVMRTGVPLWK